MEVALVLSSQNPGARESCLSCVILSRRLSTSKKPPQDNHAIPHIFQIFLCHSGCEYRILSSEFGVRMFGVGEGNNEVRVQAIYQNSALSFLNPEHRTPNSEPILLLQNPSMHQKLYTKSSEHMRKSAFKRLAKHLIQ